MAQTELTCDKLGDLDGGRARGIINAALGGIMLDLDDRGTDEKERVLKIEISFRIKKGNLAVDVKAGSKMPAYQSNSTIGKLKMKPKANGKGMRPAIEFQEHNADNPDQATFPQMDRGDDDDA